MKITYVTSSQEHICESMKITKFLTVASHAIWRQETPFSFLPYGKGSKGVIFVFLRIWCFQKSKESGKGGIFRSKVTIDYYFSFLLFPYACISHFSCVQLFVTLWTVAGQAPLSMGFSRQECWSGLPCPASGDLPDPGIEPMCLTSPALTGWFFTTSTAWEIHKYVHILLILWTTHTPFSRIELLKICYIFRAIQSSKDKTQKQTHQ